MSDETREEIEALEAVEALEDALIEIATALRLGLTFEQVRPSLSELRVALSMLLDTTEG